MRRPAGAMHAIESKDRARSPISSRRVAIPERRVRSPPAIAAAVRPRSRSGRISASARISPIAIAMAADSAATITRMVEVRRSTSTHAASPIAGEGLWSDGTVVSASAATSEMVPASARRARAASWPGEPFAPVGAGDPPGVPSESCPSELGVPCPCLTGDELGAGSPDRRGPTDGWPLRIGDADGLGGGDPDGPGGTDGPTDALGVGRGVGLCDEGDVASGEAPPGPADGGRPELSWAGDELPATEGVGGEPGLSGPGVRPDPAGAADGTGALTAGVAGGNTGSRPYRTTTGVASTVTRAVVTATSAKERPSRSRRLMVAFVGLRAGSPGRYLGRRAPALPPRPR